MKRYFNKTLFLLAVTSGILLLASCLKNNDYYVDFSKYDPSIELPLAAKNLNGPVGMDWSSDTTTYFEVWVNVASVNPLSKSVTATLDIDQEWLDQYNAEQAAAAQQAQDEYLEDTSHSTSDPGYPYSWIPMELLPDSLYELTIDDKPAQIPFDLTVPANERTAHAEILFHTDKYPAGHNYVLPFTITNSSSINISSWNHLPLWFVTSPFTGTFTNYSIVDGVYTPSRSGETVTLSTIDAHTVQMASFINWYSGTTTYHFLGDGSIEVTAVSGRDLGAETVESHSDPTTGEFYVKYKCNDLGGAVFEETFKR